MVRSHHLLRTIAFLTRICYYSHAGRPTGGLLFPRLYKSRGGDTYMTSYEELIIVFTVIGLLLTAYTLDKNNRK